MVCLIADDDEFQRLVAPTAPPVLVSFGAPWCGPCKAIAPCFERLARSHQHSCNLVFAKANVDECELAAEKCGVKTLPTFQLWARGGKIGESQGAKESELERLVAVASTLTESNRSPVLVQRAETVELVGPGISSTASPETEQRSVGGCSPPEGMLSKLSRTHHACRLC